MAMICESACKEYHIEGVGITTLWKLSHSGFIVVNLPTSVLFVVSLFDIGHEHIPELVMLSHDNMNKVIIVLFVELPISKKHNSVPQCAHGEWPSDNQDCRWPSRGYVR
jgi:hypothetical protein